MSYKKKLCIYMSFNIKRHIYTSVISWRAHRASIKATRLFLRSNKSNINQYAHRQTRTRKQLPDSEGVDGVSHGISNYDTEFVNQQ